MIGIYFIIGLDAAPLGAANYKIKESDMKNLKKVKDEKGQSLTEYALIISLIILVVISALRVFGSELLDYYNFIEANIPK